MIICTRIFFRIMLLLAIATSYICPSFAVDLEGKHLTEIAGCAHCHAASYEGGVSIGEEDRALISPNITPAVAEGIGNWSEEDIVNAIRSRISRDRTILSDIVHAEYLWMSDQDALEIARYLKSIPAVNKKQPKNQRENMDDGSWMPFSDHKKLPGYIIKPAASGTAHYGLYLVTTIANCSKCHSPGNNDPSETGFLGGSENYEKAVFNGEESNAPNIRKPLGKDRWNLDLINQHFTAHNGTLVSCPTHLYRSFSTKDREAIVHFLNSLE